MDQFAVWLTLSYDCPPKNDARIEVVHTFRTASLRPTRLQSSAIVCARCAHALILFLSRRISKGCHDVFELHDVCKFAG